MISNAEIYCNPLDEDNRLQMNDADDADAGDDGGGDDGDTEEEGSIIILKKI